MKIKKNFVMRKLGSGYVATAVGSTSIQFKGIIKLNETGAFIWKELEKDSTLENIAEKMCCIYNIDSETAIADCKKIIDQLKSAGVIDE